MVDVIAKKSDLHSLQEQAGAQFGQFGEWEVASSYEEVNREVKKVRQEAGLIDLSFHGAIRIGGKEAVQFLQGLVTNDVKNLSKGKGIQAAFLTGHGKIKALCFILCLGDEFLIINDPQTQEKVLTYVFPFSYAGDFTVDDVSKSYQVISLQGPNSYLVLKEVCFEPVPELNEYEWIETIIAGHRVLVVAHSRTGEKGFDILVPQNGIRDIWEFILLKGNFHLLQPVGMSALEILRVEAGIPVYGVDLTEANMMLEAGLDNAVSFTKGCYTGQEAVAMATYRGHVSKKLVGIDFGAEAAIHVGDKVYKAEKEIGFISSTVKSISLNRTIALSCLKYGYFEEGTVVKVISNADAYEATVVKLPFINNNSKILK